MKMETRRLVIGSASLAAALFAVSPARAQTPTLQSVSTYAAKFICGVQPDLGINSVPDAEPGRYATKINVHNNTGNAVSFRKKVIRLRGGQAPIDPQFKVLESLKEDEAMEVVCRDIYQHLNINIQPGSPPPYIEGFVIFEVAFPASGGRPLVPPTDSLDVEGIYTYKGDLPATPTSPPSGSGVSIEVVVYPAKNNGHALQ
jgi:hypothetical protein